MHKLLYDCGPAFLCICSSAPQSHRYIYVYMRHWQAGFKLASTFQRLLPTISDKSLAKYYKMPMFT